MKMLIVYLFISTADVLTDEDGECFGCQVASGAVLRRHVVYDYGD